MIKCLREQVFYITNKPRPSFVCVHKRSARTRSHPKRFAPERGTGKLPPDLRRRKGTVHDYPRHIHTQHDIPTSESLKFKFKLGVSLKSFKNRQIVHHPSERMDFNDS